MKKVFVAKCLSFLMLFNMVASCNVFAVDNSPTGELYEQSLREALGVANKILKSHPAVLKLDGDIAVVGDIHGDSKSIDAIIQNLTPWLKEEPTRKVLFLGDIFDRGNTSETFQKFLDFFNQFNRGKRPTHQVFVLRGNHETKAVFEGSSDAQRHPVIQANKELIDQYMTRLPYAAVLNKQVLAVHGGVPANLGLDSELYKNKVKSLFAPGRKWCIKNLLPGGYIGAINDILWSDFSTYEMGFRYNALRGVGFIYGWEGLDMFFKVLAEINEDYRNVRHIIRGHDHGKGPYTKEKFCDMTHTTVISSTNMCVAFAGATHSSVALVRCDGDVQEFFQLYSYV